MSDEGPGLKKTAEHYNWPQVLDRKHITTEIVTHWGGLENPQEIRNDVHRILNVIDPEELSLLIDKALDNYRTPM